MADNRLWLASRITGERALLAKAYAGGWFLPHQLGVGEREAALDAMLRRACATWRGREDGFILLAEGEAGFPDLANVWVRADRVAALRESGELVEPDAFHDLVL